jgi:hypothetical protein
MKKVIIAIICGLALLICFFTGDLYTCQMRVTGLEENNTVVCVDSAGEEWTFTGDGFKVGDTVKVYIDKNGTDNTRMDDEIISAKVVK